jgi:uncharacterized lipoprotein YddW (UPF0748 family)
MRLIIISCLFVLTVAAQPMPQPEREFRAAWIASIDNVDFPSKKTLTIEEQKAEIVRDLDLARELKLNAVIFQVRPMADAIYKSDIEPWSEFLTGKMGKPQNFDPLEFMVSEAHKRGILVHAWFNPYRAVHPLAKTEVSGNHIAKRRPDLVRQYGTYVWMDPGEKEVQEYSLSVVLDVVKRYDIDGVHFDDYFYPYPIQSEGKEVDFPDEASWKKYTDGGGKLARNDWRRKNVDDFIASVGREVKKIKPDVLYGVSPFGIWKPVPEKDIRGFNAYEKLYADARKWMQEGTVDYVAPQLYWETAKKGQSYPVLLEWWNAQNTSGRHIWPGLAVYRIGSTPTYTANEIAGQIKLARNYKPSGGTIHFSFKWFRTDHGGINGVLKKNVYQRDAIMPVSPWIKIAKPLAPKVEIRHYRKYVRASWIEQGPRMAFWFVVYAKDKNGWSYSVLPSNERSITLSGERKIEKIVVTSVDRLGNESGK